MRDCAADGCTHRIVTGWQWQHADHETRRAWLADGVHRHEGRGLCRPCSTRDPSTPGPPRRMHPVAEVVEEYEHLTAQGMDVADVAAALGMKKDTLQRSLLRARERGLLVA